MEPSITRSQRLPWMQLMQYSPLNPQIDGLQLDRNRGGFTFIGDDGAHILGIRNRLEDSVFEYIWVAPV